MREKLIELLDVGATMAENICGGMACDDCCGKDKGCTLYHIADYLISCGVTVTDNNVGSKWIPVTERLPDSGKCVLIYSEDGMVAEGNYTAYDKKWYQFRWSVKGQKVTHWMPLPEAPTTCHMTSKQPPKGE